MFFVFSMDKKVKKFSSINYEEKDVIGQLNKRFKYTEQNVIDDIASSIKSIAETTKSIGKNHEVFLEVNKALVLFLLEREKENKEKFCNLTQDTTLEQQLENTSSKSIR